LNFSAEASISRWRNEVQPRQRTQKKRYLREQRRCKRNCGCPGRPQSRRIGRFRFLFAVESVWLASCPRSASSTVDQLMTATTEHDQIFFRVVAGLTSHFSAVDLEAFHRTTA